MNAWDTDPSEVRGKTHIETLGIPVPLSYSLQEDAVSSEVDYRVYVSLLQSLTEGIIHVHVTTDGNQVRVSYDDNPSLAKGTRNRSHLSKCRFQNVGTL